MSDRLRPLLVVQPSADYAGRVRARFPEAVLLATPERAVQLAGHPQVIAADLDDPQAALLAVRDYARRQGLTYGGIVCFVCERLPLTAYLARELGLPFHREEVVRLTRNKALSGAAWQAAGVPTPRFRPVRTPEELLSFAAAHPGPWILKPVDRSGSEWVLRVESAEDLLPAHRRLTKGLAKGMEKNQRSPIYLVQQWVSGRDFGADLYLEDGQVQILRLTEKYLLREPGVAGIVGAYYVAQVDEQTLALLQETFRRGALALGLERGIAMVDVILAEGIPYLLEMALRPGGDCLPDLCRLALGYDPIYTACQVALGGRPAPVRNLPPRPLAAVHLMTRQSGRVRRIDCRRLVAHPRVVQLIEVYHRPGEEVRCWEGSYDDRILAACLVHCLDPAELPDLCTSLADLIELELEPLSTF